MITPAPLSRRLSVAPMMDWTDRHCRFFLRLISARTLLYTEMITAQAILRGDRQKLLGYDQAEHPVALQLGGSDPALLAEAAKIGEEFGYDEINLNCGCPSDRVQSGRFGACLMLEPELVREGLAAMRAAVKVPVTVKHRIGVDEVDSYEALQRFVAVVGESGVTSFSVHARKAWLSGLSPKENREIPPLSYPTVARLKADFPEYEFILNGGVRTLDAAAEHLKAVDGVMIGRAAYETPYILAEADRLIFDDASSAVPSRREIIKKFMVYVQAERDKGTYLRHMTRHILGLFNGAPRARSWRRILTEGAVQDTAGVEVIERALDALPASALDWRAGEPLPERLSA
ncbi:MAG TPA: tRNA dihydrouridine(20/20a) synthase DusA [Alphaproteobacteria bacterium]|nr:tRNA dihydrouridine(20/20a) synthase DusA [Alphaproteobacteria bacterium]